jgi:N-acetyl-alpha-D-muramate 1-phosphate uridylyltransferase
VSSLPVAVLAGGLATRLRPLTERLPKALLPVAGHPFIFHQLELLREQGVRRVVLCVGHLGEQIRAAVGTGRGLGLTIDYSFDGDELKGTGGALQRALPLLGPEFFVLNGDSYTPYPLARVEAAFAAAGLPALMAVLRNENRWDKSNVSFGAGKLIEYDKRSARTDMHHIDYGICVVSREVISAYSGSKPFDLSDVLHGLSLLGQLGAVEVSGRFYEIGSPQGLRDTDAYLSRIGSLSPRASA